MRPTSSGDAAGGERGDRTPPHPLDRTIWTALTTRQADHALVSGGARRFDPAFSPFAACADDSVESLAGLVDLVPRGGQVYLQGDAIAAPAGFALRSMADTVLMVAERIDGAPVDVDIALLRDEDGPEMKALAELTRPGPFAERTHELGRFVGVRVQGRIVAMAGERLKAGPFTEISGVCTHPDHRGRGYAAALMRDVAQAIVARGETPFLHAYADNAGAIALYERLGFVVRSRPTLVVLERL